MDEPLFGLGAHRYEALVNLLIQLRQPQLSKKPDEKLLSRALTEALPPLSPGLVTTVAEAFRGLDEERDALRALAEAQEAATDLPGPLPPVREGRGQAQGRRAAAGAEPLRAARPGPRRRRGGTSRPPSGSWTARSANSKNSRGSAPSWRRGARRCRHDPAMRDAERLDQLREDAARKEKAAQDREADRDRQAGQVTRYADKAARTAHQAGTGRDKLAQALGEAASTAADARCARPHQAAVAALDGEHGAVAAYLDAPEAPAAGILARARRDAQAIADRQAQAVAQLARMLDESATCERQLRAAQEAEGRLSAEVQAAADRVAAADQAVAERMGLLLAAYRLYLSGLAELRVADPEELTAALESWGLTGEGANPAVALIDAAARAAGAELGNMTGKLSAQRTRHLTRAGELTEEIGRLRAGGHDAPPAPHTRAAGVRDGRPGAPLWKVTDFAPGLPDDERAGLEAALEAAGILDAWVTPEGNLVDGDVIVFTSVLN